MELIEELPKDATITFYDLKDPRSGEVLFTDLCKGPHIDDLSKVEAFRTASSAAVGSSNKDASALCCSRFSCVSATAGGWGVLAG